jgi:DNA-binding IclR family transcriptional regulator
MSSERSQTLERGLEILDLMSAHPEGLSVTDIARELDVGRTVVYRLVTTLDYHGFLRRSSDGRCRLGVAALLLARQIQPMLRDSAMPVLRRLADTIGATAQLTLLDGSDGLVVAVVEPARTDVHVALRVGARHPADRSIAGRAALLSRPSGRAVDPGQVVAGQDPQLGGWSIAAPVHGVPWLESAIAVVSLVELDPAKAGPVVVAAAQDTSRLLR